jgi:hypothetical protein
MFPLPADFFAPVYLTAEDKATYRAQAQLLVPKLVQMIESTKVCPVLCMLKIAMNACAVL